jgi:hypothetical protein
MKWQKTRGPVSVPFAALLCEPARVGAAFVKDPARRQRAPSQRASRRKDMVKKKREGVALDEFLTVDKEWR